eukprot:Hpha_TRINITY_DN15371_c1_g4::TRINITY_DN15371_c1_g4_i1::g.92302::m.92302
MRSVAVLAALVAGAEALQWNCTDDRATCNTCDACCHSYIAQCNQCVSEQCATPPPGPQCNESVVQGKDIPGADLKQLPNVTRQSCSDACCGDVACVAYVFLSTGAPAWGGCIGGASCCFLKTAVGTKSSSGEHYAGFITRLTPAPPPPPPTPVPTPVPTAAHVCNGTCTEGVCAACCHPYIANGPACEACVQQQCATPAPPTPAPTGPGGCIPDGQCLPSNATCCSGISHISGYCNNGGRCEAFAPTPGGCVPADQCLQLPNQTCCSGKSHISFYCPQAARCD